VTTSGTAVEAVVIPVAALVGLFIGSFLNVVVYRAPLGLSVSTPRSFCPTCDRTLAWWENVPLVSWLFLRGRCHTCHQRISIRYPLVEAGTAVVFALVAWAWHGTLPTAGYCVLAATALSIGLIEVSGQRAPLAVGAIGTGLGALLLVPGLLVVHRGADLIGAAIGLVAGVVAFAALRAHDPDCSDARFHGRTALPLAGLWLGGLGGRAVVAGLAGWVLASFACLVSIWISVRLEQRAGDGGGTHRAPALAGVPLVTGIVVALAVSLGVAG
jgi:leader peptidase (prepilin peptidase)/N-methyltransferase